MNAKLFRLLSLVTLLVVTAVPAAASAPAGDSAALGDFTVYAQTIPVHLVFVGFDRSAVDRDAVLASLPAAYTPLVRLPQFYGLPGRDLGLHYVFDYRLVHAPAEFADRFFSYLAAAGTSEPLTLYQQLYNDQDGNRVDVSDTVLFVDAPSTERWLASHAHELGIDGGQSYTVFFINGYGRSDFQFHVYTKTDEPDPDTGVSFGAAYDEAKMVSWGGTHSRTWFYDFSAGPEVWAGNFNISDDDLDGDGLADYRIPPIWEYHPEGYRDPAALSTDVALLTRFVAINLLFTPSPLYDPMVTSPGVDGAKIAHISVFEDDPDSNGLDWISAEFVRSKMHRLQPYYPWQVNLADYDPVDPGAERAFRIFAELLVEDDCWNDFLFPFAQLFCYFDANRDVYLPPYGPTDYVAGTYLYNTTDENMGVWFGLLGFADDNWVDGTQSYVFEFAYPGVRAFGYGSSVLTVHELGHHFGLSHPHDGYDAEYAFDYGPGGDFYFIWAGDESHTVMSYIQLAGGFGVFNQDNMYRWEMAGYLNAASQLLDDVLADPDAHMVAANLRQAESHRTRAVQSFKKWDYLPAAAHARQYYVAVLAAAEVVGVTPAQVAAPQLPAGLAAPHEGDPVRYPGVQP